MHALITQPVPARLPRPGELRSRRARGAARALPEMSWDFEWGTNMQHALLLARKMLSQQSGTKQMIMVTDGEPTAHITPDGYAHFEYPSSPITIEETLKEVMRCTRDGIRINTFMLDESFYLRSFIERMMRINRRPRVLHHPRHAR